MKKIFSFALCFFAFIYVLLGTSIGLQLTYRVATLFIPGAVSLESLSGQVMGPISIKNFRYHDDTTTVAIKFLTINWQWQSLLERKFIIKTLIADGADIDVIAEEDPNNKMTVSEIIDTTISVLKMLKIDFADAKNIIIHQADNVYFQINSLNIIPNGKMHTLLLNSSLATLQANYRFKVSNDDFYWNVTADSVQINLTNLSENSNGQFHFSFASEGEWGTHKKSIDILVPTIDGTLNHYPLSGNINVHFHHDRLKVNSLNFSLGNAKLQSVGELGIDKKLLWQLNIPELSLIAPTIKGMIAGNGVILLDNDKPKIMANLSMQRFAYQKIRIGTANAILNVNFNKLAANDLIIKAQRITIDKINIPSLTIKSFIAYSPTLLQIKSTLNLDDNNMMAGDTQIRNPMFNDLMNQEVDGRYKIQINNFKTINQIIHSSEIKLLSGLLTGNLEINGKLAQPAIIAAIQVNNGSLLLPSVNIKLRNILLNANYNNAQPIKISSQFNINRDQASLTGDVGFKNNILSVALNLKGNNLRLINTREYKITASPDILFTLNNDEININGTLLIPSATIAPDEHPNTVALPDDVVFVDRKKSTSWLKQLNLSVLIKLGDQVFFDYYNLKARLIGEVRVNQHSFDQLTAVGEINTVDGTYKAYGKNLTIETGRIIYTGNSLYNPGITLKAYQNVKNLSYGNQFNSMSDTGARKLAVGVTVKGSLSKPLLSFYSNPAGLTQAEIMSYLLVGAPPSEASSASVMALFKAASSVTGTDAKGFGVQDKLGLDELNIGSTEYFDPTNGTQSSTTFNVGRHLSKRLSIHYSIGVFDPVSILSLRYKINKHFSLQTETSSLESGGDVFYHVESEQ